MYYFLLTILILDALLLGVVVLLQSGTGGGLAAMGGGGGGGSSDSLFGSRQAATLLTKSTWWTGGIFLVLSFVLSLLSSRVAQPSSILEGTLQAPPPATQPLTPSGTGTLPVEPANPTTSGTGAAQGEQTPAQAPAGQ